MTALRDSGAARASIGERDSGRVVGRVVALYRYPVKSTAGEELASVPVTAAGLRHDRQWAAYTTDGGIASGKRTRRFRPVNGLMQWQSTASDDEEIAYLLSPSGRRFRVDDPAASAMLTAALGQPLALRAETTTRHHDESPIHLLTTSSVAAVESLVGAGVDARRFRANIIVDTGAEPRFVEDDWSGALLAVGPQVVLRLGPAMVRCVMIDQPQAGLSAQPKALKALNTERDMMLGLQAHAVHGGAITLADSVRLVSPS